MRTRFIQELEFRNYSPRTIRNYVGVIKRLSLHFGQSPDQLSTLQIKSYLYHCKDKEHLSISLINQTIGALRILFRDVLELPLDRHLSIKRPRRTFHLPVILSKPEVKLLIHALINPKHVAMIALLYSTGMRRDELLQLRITDVDSDRMLIRINNGKGNKSRDVILSEKTLTLLRKYYQCHHHKPSTYLFESIQAGKPYSATSLGKVVKKAAKRAGIAKNVTPHTLRHTFATHMLEQGENLKTIQYLMGHTSLRATMVYLHLAQLDPSIKSPLDYED
ncbi:MAG: site-specific integrase [Cyclobacteriaceae bacterium]